MIAPEHDMGEHGCMLVDFLKKELAKRKASNPRYSLRAFAGLVDVDSSTLSKIFLGKRKLGFEMASRILERLKIDPSQRSILLLDLRPDATFPLDTDYTALHGELAYKLMRHWQFYAVLSYLEINKSRNPAKKLAASLGTDKNLIQEILDGLETLGLVQKEEGRYILTNVRLTAPPTYPKEVMFQVHEECIHKAIESMRTRRAEDRDITGMTFTMPKSKLPEAKERLKQFRRSLAEYLTQDNDQNDSVFRLNIQLFPLID